MPAALPLSKPWLRPAVRAGGFALAWLAVSAVALSFRLYPFRAVQAFTSAQAAARSVVYERLLAQIEGLVEKTSPGLSKEARRGVALDQARQTLADEAGRFEEAVQREAQARTQAPAGRRSRYYLLEADPYYYLHLTQTLRDTGRQGSPVRRGEHFDPYRGGPAGVWEHTSLHPYVGLFWFRLSSVFLPGIELMEALCYVPLVLMVAVLAGFFLLCALLGTGVFASAAGGLALALAPIGVQRSSFGWYDTDPYNLLIPTAVLIFYHLGVRGAVPSLAMACLGGALTGLYSYLWTGWPLLLVTVTLGASVAAVFEFLRGGAQGKRLLAFAAVFAATGLAVKALLSSPQELWVSFFQGGIFLKRFSPESAGLEPWPSGLTTTGEAVTITLRKLVMLTGHAGLYAVAALGAVWSGARAWRKAQGVALSTWLVLLVMTGALVILALRTERFALLVTLPLALWVAMGVEALARIVANPLARRVPGRVSAFAVKIAGALALAVLLLPMSLAAAYVSGNAAAMIMDDVWYESLQEVRAKTPPDAYLHTWWPPGFFIISLARRRVITDGGSQHRPDAYWMARALMASDERQAAGILRMLETSNNEAVRFLESLGFETSQAIDLTAEIVSLRAEEAFGRLPAGMTPASKLKLLSLTHGPGPPPPACVMIYQDLIEQNLAVTLMAQWDFRKARELAAVASEPDPVTPAAVWDALRRKGWGVVFALSHGIPLAQAGPRAGLAQILGSFFERTWRARWGASRCVFEKLTRWAVPKAPRNFYQDLLAVTRRVLKYTPEAQLERREGDRLFFSNGLQVDLATMDAVVVLPDRGLNGRPDSLFYVQDGGLLERDLEGDQVDVSALLIEQGGVYSSVLADAELIRSLMFRLYFLNGRGLDLFQPLLARGDRRAGNAITVHAVNWAGFTNPDKST